jgi:hypothetical protein
MGEDFPLDPNQVQQPQEGGEVTHVEVTSHEDETQLGGVALNSEGNDNEPTHLGSVDHDDSSTGGEVPETYVRNEEKAEIMAHAQNDKIDESRKLERQGRYDEIDDEDGEWAAEWAGREYEVGNALAKYAHEGVTNPEEALRLAKHDRNVFLKYGHAIAENHRKHGDKLSLELEAVDKVYDYQQKMTKLGGDKLWDFQGYVVSMRQDATIKTEKGYYGGMDVLLVRKSGEEWSLSMFDGGEYKVSKTEFDPDAEFQETQTIRKRHITEEDVAHLDETLTGWVDDHVKRADAEKRRQYYEDLEAEDEQDDMRKELSFQRHLDETGDWQEAQRRAGVTPSR